MLVTSEDNNKLTEKLGLNSSSGHCVNCNHGEFKQITEGYDFDTGEKPFNLESCANCGLTRTTPLLNDSELSAYYESSYYGATEKKFNFLIEAWTIWTNNRLAKTILSKYKRGKESNSTIKVLDIGCGRANLLKAFRRQDCDCFGIERADFPSDSALNDIIIYKEDVCNVPFEDDSFDVIVIWHVLEHLVNPAITLNRVAKILKPGGLLIIGVPNFGGLQSKLFGKHWFHLDLPRHTYHFTIQTLTTMLNDNGISVASVSTGCPDQSIFGFIQSAANKLLPGKPNTLYTILKAAQKKPDLITLATNFLIACILIPVAVIEFLLSVATGKGACLIVSALKKQTKNIK